MFLFAGAAFQSAVFIATLLLSSEEGLGEYFYTLHFLVVARIMYRTLQPAHFPVNVVDASCLSSQQDQKGPLH